MSRTPHRMLKLARSLAVPLVALTLSGCAAQLAYREGNSLVEQDKVEAGLLKFQEAIANDPANAQYRAAYLRARDRATVRYLAQAERDLAEGGRDAALQGYLRVLALDPLNERGRAGLRLVESAERLDKMVAAAQELAAKKDYDGAKAKLGAVLAERPGHEQARLALRDVTDKSAQPSAESGLSKAFKQPITIEFRDAPLKQVFEVIARRSGLNFVFDKDVKTDTKASIYLKNSTVESAVYYLLMTNQLEQQVLDGNTILIYPNVAAKLKEYQEMVVKTFFLANAEAKAVANTLKTILKSRDVVVDEKLNLLIVRDNPEAIRLAERLVNLQDVAEPEVMLDVEILEVKRTRLMELGVAWPSQLTLSPLISSGGNVLTINDLNHLNQRTIGLSSLSATINANKTDGDTNLLANPRIRVRNKEKAKVLIGDKVPVITTTISPGTGGFASESVSYVDVGLTLNAEPTIYLNNEVAIRISLEVSNLVSQIETKSGTKAYQIGTRQASTMLQLKDGENQVLAGLINNEDRSTGSKVPLVGDLPILGRLFGSTVDDKQKTEIVLSITPHLVRNVQRPEAANAEFSAGTEGNFRRRPDPAVRAPVALPAAPGAPVRPLSPNADGGQAPGAAAPGTAPAAIPGAVPVSVPAPVTGVPVAPPAPEGVPLSTMQPGPASTPAQPEAQEQPPQPPAK
ncbi:secretin N-terminal domain-containing protein [Pseudoduganella namucuonensis]|uniref:General secretion pathway protein D n=1 Tax=Pseudoduganella namucuonensis TaxID=1035707 RepID=A0A1I7LY85_9BURK|nr:secretin N-terminal domain-containing protein [Pseudoduganella namucuonensis]SFV14638.1 general secretion pathway protein D [Pseudoduganella namucuonensis]